MLGLVVYPLFWIYLLRKYYSTWKPSPKALAMAVAQILFPLAFVGVWLWLGLVNC